MNDRPAPPREVLLEPLGSGSSAVQRRADEIAHDRATVEASLGRLRADEQSLVAELSALRIERRERAQELADAREHLTSLDAALAGEELMEVARARDLAYARHRLERDRELASQLEQHILEIRRHMSSAQEQLIGLVKNVLRIQHKLWRVAHGTGESRPAHE
jgi:chromosome segregation ATPase